MIDMSEFGIIGTHPNGELLPARVTEVHRNFYTIVCEEGEAAATLKGTLASQAFEAQDFPAVGDFVWVRYNAGQPVIHEIMPRKSKFSRPDYSGHKAGYVKTIVEQVVAANFDYVFILCSLNSDFSLARIRRYLTAALRSGGIPVVLLTKSDLYPNPEDPVRQVQAVYPAVDVLAISAKTGDGIEGLSPYLGKGKTLVFLGSSGVGKSSLVNVLAREERMKVREIREYDGKGRHTTTHRQLMKLPDGTLIIDTPGMRELSLWDADGELGELFPDVVSLTAQCRFSNCRHETEPGCAVKAALASGALMPQRWRDYIKLKQEAAYTDQKAVYSPKHAGRSVPKCGPKPKHKGDDR